MAPKLTAGWASPRPSKGLCGFGFAATSVSAQIMGFWHPTLPTEPFCSIFPVSQRKSAVLGVCGKLYFQTDGLPHILYLRKLSAELLELLDNHVFLKPVPAWQDPAHVWGGTDGLLTRHV